MLNCMLAFASAASVGCSLPPRSQHWEPAAAALYVFGRLKLLFCLPSGHGEIDGFLYTHIEIEKLIHKRKIWTFVYLSIYLYIYIYAYIKRS